MVILIISNILKRRKEIYVDFKTPSQQSNLKVRLEKELLHFIWGMHGSRSSFWKQIFQGTSNVLTQPTELKKPTQGKSQKPNWFHVWLREFISFLYSSLLHKRFQFSYSQRSKNSVWFPNFPKKYISNFKNNSNAH